MKTQKKLLSAVLAVVVIASTLLVGTVSASAAKSFKTQKPAGLKVANTNISIQISWKKLAGAKKYQIYRNNKLLTTVKSVSFKDINVHGGTTYAYKVRAIKGSQKSKFTAAKKVMRINPTIINTIDNTATGVKLVWAKRAGASSYKVERKDSGSYTLLKEVTGLEYTDETAVGGTKYTYRVTCYHAGTKANAVTSTALSITRLAPVTNVTAVKAADNTRKITVKWTASEGAASYNVYRQKATDADFSKIATVPAVTEYVDNDIADNASAYRYYVTAVKDDSESVASAERAVQTYSKKAAEYDSATGVYKVYIDLKVGEKYEEGKALAEYFSYNGNFEVKNDTANADVVSIKDNVITALKAGTATLTISVPDAAKALITDGMVKTMVSKTINVVVTVTA